MSTNDTTQYALTTIDNPFNPFTEFNEWHMWDVTAGYNTSALLARLANVSNSLSETDQAQAINDAIDEIVSENVNGMFIKVSRDGSTTMETDHLSSDQE